jgi:hypothetical protein
MVPKTNSNRAYKLLPQFLFLELGVQVPPEIVKRGHVLVNTLRC